MDDLLFSLKSLLLYSFFPLTLLLLLLYYRFQSRKPTPNTTPKPYPLVRTLPDLIRNWHWFLQWTAQILNDGPTRTRLSAVEGAGRGRRVHESLQGHDEPPRATRFMSITWKIKKLINIGSKKKLKESIKIIHDIAMKIIKTRKAKTVRTREEEDEEETIPTYDEQEQHRGAPL